MSFLPVDTMSRQFLVSFVPMLGALRAEPITHKTDAPFPHFMATLTRTGSLAALLGVSGICNPPACFFVAALPLTAKAFVVLTKHVGYGESLAQEFDKRLGKVAQVAGAVLSVAISTLLAIKLGTAASCLFLGATCLVVGLEVLDHVLRQYTPAPVTP